MDIELQKELMKKMTRLELHDLDRIARLEIEKSRKTIFDNQITLAYVEAELSGRQGE